jgi:hypothetical protein
VREEDELPGAGLLQRNWWYLPGFECGRGCGKKRKRERKRTEEQRKRVF